MVGLSMNGGEEPWDEGRCSMAMGIGQQEHRLRGEMWWRSEKLKEHQYREGYEKIKNKNKIYIYKGTSLLKLISITYS